MTENPPEFAVERWLGEPGRKSAERNVVVKPGEESPSLRPAQFGAEGTGLLAMPAPVNAHDHGYGVRTLDFGCIDDALEPWISGLRQRPPTDPYLEALVAFGRIAASGCGATMHCHNSLNAENLVAEAGEVARAAADCGIRVGLSCPLLDNSPFVYGGLEALSGHLDAATMKRLREMAPQYAPAEVQLEAVAEIARAHEGPRLTVQYGPIGPQWCSDRLLERIAEESALHGRRIHMHLLESPRQRQWLDRRFPQGIVAHLDEIGFLSPRLAVAHGVQLRPDECELLAARGVRVVTNPSANLRLRSGIAPVATMQNAGLDFAIGLDGTGFDDSQDIWQEARLLWLLHGGKALERSLPASALFEALISSGAEVVGQDCSGDLVVLDYAAMTADAVFDDLDESDVLLTRMHAGLVRDLFVDGRAVMRGRKLSGFDFDAARGELLAQARAAKPQLEKARGDASFLSGVIRDHYARTSGD